MTIKELCKKHTNCSVCPYISICGDSPENYNLDHDLEVTNAIIETAKELEQQPCEDAVSRQAVIDTIFAECSSTKLDIDFAKVLLLQRKIKALPSVQLKPKVGHCKDCKYFEYDHFENMGGIPLITTHKVCKRHGLICKTDEDGYCHLWEHKAESKR